MLATLPTGPTGEGKQAQKSPLPGGPGGEGGRRRRPGEGALTCNVAENRSQGVVLRQPDKQKSANFGPQKVELRLIKAF
jgi:hypothetical protein